MVFCFSHCGYCDRILTYILWQVWRSHHFSSYTWRNSGCMDVAFDHSAYPLSKRKLQLHRKPGKIAGFTLVPLLILGGLKMMKLMFEDVTRYPPNIPYRLSFIDAYSLIFFLLCFILAIQNSGNIHLHARYMACTILIVLPPALT